MTPMVLLPANNPDFLIMKEKPHSMSSNGTKYPVKPVIENTRFLKNSPNLPILSVNIPAVRNNPNPIRSIPVISLPIPE